MTDGVVGVEFPGALTDEWLSSLLRPPRSLSPSSSMEVDGDVEAPAAQLGSLACSASRQRSPGSSMLFTGPDTLVVWEEGGTETGTEAALLPAADTVAVGGTPRFDPSSPMPLGSSNPAADATVTMAFVGAAEGIGPRTADYKLTIVEHPTFVETAVVTTRDGGGTCLSVSCSREVTATQRRQFERRSQASMRRQRLARTLLTDLFRPRPQIANAGAPRKLTSRPRRCPRVLLGTFPPA